jgi:hypothetical protein
MTALRSFLSAFLDGLAPDGDILRMRFRTKLDSLITLLVTLLAVALAIGYQVVGRWARRAGWVD